MEQTRQSGGGSIHVHITTQLAPVALPYMSISGGGRLENLKWPRQNLCWDFLGNLGSDQSCSMDAWETDRLVLVLFLLPPCRFTGVHIHLLKMVEGMGTTPT